MEVSFNPTPDLLYSLLISGDIADFLCLRSDIPCSGRILRYIRYIPFRNLQGGISISALACAYSQADIPAAIRTREEHGEETHKSEEVKQLLTLSYIIRWSAEGRGKGTKIKVRIPKNIKCMRGIESFIYPPLQMEKREKKKNER